ncbi:neurotrypsin-like [Amblyraja radiata]|uniref:neurotrypsin-like n=1 Tax=Amblyraja radiata TaxID=386614 RepID=UPI0014024CD5|nr:neurotrypsin-like [Amblyraja radiata]
MMLLVWVLFYFTPSPAGTEDIGTSRQTNDNRLPVPSQCASGVTEQGHYTGSAARTVTGEECVKWTEFPDYVEQYPHRGLGDHNLCRNPDGSPAPWCFYRRTSGSVSWAECDCRHGAVRLSGGASPREGRVELFWDGEWGTICDTTWDSRDATVACRQLGLSEIGVGRRNSPFGPGLGPVHMAMVHCDGDEVALGQCRHSMMAGSICGQDHNAAVVCGLPEGTVMPIRLVGGKEHYEGRVEVYHHGQWGSVCDDQWDDLDAEVVCRQMGLSGTAKSWMWSHFGQGLGPILLDEVECTGNELSMDECRRSNWGEHNCDHSEDAGVSCDPFTDGAVRLQGGRSSSEGRVEIYRNGVWGTVCDDKWTEQNAEVVCRQLGLSGPGMVAPEGQFGEGSGFIFLDDVVCGGTELDLLGCGRSNWGQHDCSHHEDVGVICVQETNKVTASHSGPAIRLVDGENSKEGRVEVYVGGEWGSICDDGWTDNDARVVCRQLGYSGPSKARTMAYFGEGRGPIHLDNVKCTGQEPSLDECVTPGYGIHNCWHSEDAGVICDYQEDPLEELASSGSLHSVCGLRFMKHRRKRIIGGNKSIRGGWPWQSSLRLRTLSRESRLLCGATLISNCWVLTAAHCFKRFGNNTKRYFIRVGDYHTGVEDEYEREIPVEMIVVHRKYKPDSSDNDIALVRVKGRDGHCMTFNQHTSPVCLPSRKEKHKVNRQSCYITGWGDTGRSYSRTLLQGSVPLLPRGACEGRYRSKFTARMMCAGNLSEHKRVDSCQGDSGGPLVCQRTGGHWVIMGVTSWGYGCGRKDSPGVYTKVSKFVNWIKKVTDTNVRTQALGSKAMR